MNKLKKLKIVLIMVLLLAAQLSYGQRKADKQISFDGKIEDFFFHDFSGVPIVLTDKTVAGIDEENGTKIWEVKGERISILGGAIQSDQENYRMVPYSPYIIVDNKLIDTRSGKLLLDADKDGYKSIGSFEIIPELESFLFQTTTKDKTKLKVHLISLKQNKALWNKEFTVKRGDIGNVVVDKNKNIAFSLGSKLNILNGESGETILSEDQKVGKLFFNPSKDILYVVEPSGGLGLGAAMTMNMNKLMALGKKIMAYSIGGKKLWKKPLKLEEAFMFEQEVDGKLFIKHEKGGKLYDYKTGESLWKKDFSSRRLSRIEKVSEGYMIYYKSKNMLVDGGGKKLWKKAKSNGKDFIEDIGDVPYDEFRYEKGSIVATTNKISYYEDGVKKPIWRTYKVDEDTKIAYDKNEKTLVVLEDKRLYLLNPDKGWNKEHYQKLQLKKHRDFNRLEIREGTYFMSSPWEYVIIGKEGEVKKLKYYKQPGESGRKLLNVASVLGAAASSASEMSGLYNLGVGASSGVGEAVTGFKTPGTGGFSQMDKGGNQYVNAQYGYMASEALYNPNRLDASADTRDYAFYFTKAEGIKYLVQVNKDSGEELDKFVFEDNSPLYHVDEIEQKVIYAKGKEIYIFDYK